MPLSPRSGAIRLAFVTHALVPGGAERQMLLLAERLPKDEFAVEFVCIQTAGADADRARAAGAHVRVVGLKPRRDAGLPRPIYALSVAWGILRFVLMTAGRYDVVDAWLYHAYSLVALTRPLTRPRAVIAGRRSLSTFKARFNRLERIADRLARSNTDLVIANSNAVRADVALREGLPPERIRVISNAVLPATPLLADDRRRRRRGWGADDDTLVIGCVANYRPFKGLELVVAAAARLAAVRDRATLRVVLVGEGRHRGRLGALRSELGVGDVVVLHGSEPDARDVYGAFDVAVLASEAEGLPNVLLEAAAAGLPIVATAAGGTVDVIEDGRTGLLIPIGDEDALLAALQRLADDPAERRRLGDAARADVLERFGVERMVDEFIATYREMARRGRSASATP
jgi:glycosyltransferase involved in cell wall biosynthesis